MKHSPFEVRAVIEGFYGVYYTFEERNDLIRFIGELGYNQYIYGPKNDRQHRMRWREPYPEWVMDEFGRTARIAREAGVEFCYSIGSGVSMIYASEEDFRLVTDKFRAFYDRGVTAFSILLDDIASEFSHEEDRQRYATYAEAHADVTNRLYVWLKELDPSCTLSLCPTDYHGVPPFSDYLHELGEKLHPEVDIFYTGPEICSTRIETGLADEFGKALRRKPLIWDNYPVNDLVMRHELHVGPILGRDADLHTATRGFAVNLMIQAEASKIALVTFADYFRDPSGYDAWTSWDRALRRLAGEDSFEQLRLFCEQLLESCLKTENAVNLRGYTARVMDSLERGEPAETNANLDALEAYVTALDEACYHLKNRMRNVALRNNLLPWIELLENWHWMTKRGIEVLKALEKGEPHERPLKWMTENLEQIRKHPKKIAGSILMPFADYVQKRVEQVQAQA